MSPRRDSLLILHISFPKEFVRTQKEYTRGRGMEWPDIPRLTCLWIWFISTSHSRKEFIGTTPTPRVHECPNVRKWPTRKLTPAELLMILGSLGAVSSRLHVLLIVETIAPVGSMRDNATWWGCTYTRSHVRHFRSAPWLIHTLAGWSIRTPTTHYRCRASKWTRWTGRHCIKMLTRSEIETLTSGSMTRSTVLERNQSRLGHSQDFTGFSSTIRSVRVAAGFTSSMGCR